MTAIMQAGAESDREDNARAAREISVTSCTSATIVERLPATIADAIGYEGKRYVQLVDGLDWRLR